MKTISIKDDFNKNDLGDIFEVNEIISKIKIDSNSVIELNLRHCFIDYPATSQIIDSILFQLDKIDGKKELIIKQDYYLPESIVLNLMLLGSKYFKIEARKEIELEIIKEIITKQINKDNIIIEINVVNRTGELIETYKYGN